MEKYNNLFKCMIGTYLALGVNLFIMLLGPIGRSANIQAFLQTIVKG